MATPKTPIIAFLIFLLFSTPTTSTATKKPVRGHLPCKEMVFYFHDVLFNGQNHDNATSAIVGSPQWGNKTTMATPFSFGDLVIFDDPITLDNNFHGPSIGRAQGMYLYDQRSIYGAWLAFSFLFNSSAYIGTLNFVGADPLMNKTRDISIVGGTGDFFMTRGIATLMTDSFEGEVYFRLRVDIKLYECWQ
ncbi:hypothetical protein Leryth_001665 [Lithospermum erythrorhizon]|uniref:Dirigent protein n=1 Tax=Lithospermum erythrorhizon TaxID=34254 RepID=A0AAV3Q5S1_LITER|nr:hypothetical protein Leryth_001665 [Lithospermum erythrorhizon]